MAQMSLIYWTLLVFISRTHADSLARESLSINSGNNPSYISSNATPSTNVKRTANSNCQPFVTTFSPGDVSSTSFSAPFFAISPQDSYSIKSNGLQLYLRKPEVEVTRHGDTNDVQGQGATINSTFLFQYAKITYEMQAPTVAGSVTAGITIGDDTADEIDVELIGGDTKHWQTNVYSPSPKDKQPLWGVFGETHSVGSSSIAELHNYTIDWSQDRIIWSVDGRSIRTLKPENTRINGTLHYPTHASRIQLGIWDASSPEGTSQWAKGPINWDKAPNPIVATVRRISVECN